MVSWEVASFNKLQVDQDGDKWREIEEDRNVQSPMTFVDESVNLTKETSMFPEIDITGLVFHMEVTMVLEDSLLHFVVD